ncbi:lactonase family protein [Granulicella sibirica]|uniref:Putative hemagglutinin-related protein n=1 Tax=Granulicella sibirica TaxID=2479048 RepID=A0A4Q0SVI3_9BACT|nr:beta-propeller fold lactonase family protein [Granulicella sibirica]RXH55085.1 putative hemagglutinin-related protein [Granulicella sibirica]
MKLSKIGRISMAFVASVAMGLGMTACGGGTIGFMWVLGTQYNQIAGFKIDDFTGNLTAIPHSPFASGGTNPVMLAVKPGGRYVYVINKATGTNGNISEFSVGGDGVLTFQQSYSSQGNTPVWLAVDSGGNFLYVLDQQAPALTTTVNGVTTTTAQTVGDITVFAIAADTGRLTLVTNQQSLSSTGVQKTYFPVGGSPTQVRVTSGGCLFTVNSADQTISPYQTNSSTGQLTLTTNSTITTSAQSISSINVSGSNVYLTDTGANQILPYTVGTNCALNTANGGAVNNLALTSGPTQILVDSTSKYLYVINQSTTNSQNANSTISAFTIDATTGKLQALADTNNPYSIGSGPVCLAEDPTNQYIYTSNNTDGTVTGKIIDKNTGKLSALRVNSTFPATGQATCLAISGNVS